MSENIKKLLELASSNRELADKVNSASKEELVAIAKEQGIDLTEADFEAPKGTVGDDELDVVTGGAACYCGGGGGGTGEEIRKDKTCVCILYGHGNMSDGSTRCVCPYAGVGYDHKI